VHERSQKEVLKWTGNDTTSVSKVLKTNTKIHPTGSGTNVDVCNPTPTAPSGLGNQNKQQT
jgi:hypothetical protein